MLDFRERYGILGPSLKTFSELCNANAQETNHTLETRHASLT